MSEQTGFYYLGISQITEKINHNNSVNIEDIIYDT